MTTESSTKIAFDRILIPTDFSSVSGRAIEYAKAIARGENSELMLAHINPPINPVVPPEAAWVNQEELVGRIGEQLEQSVSALHSEGFRARSISPIGPLQDEILSIVKRERADLVVLGTHGKKGLERLMFGSDAEAVLRHLSCPVFTVGPKVAEPPDRVWRPKTVLCATTLLPHSARTAAYALTLAKQFGSHFILLHVHPKAGHAGDWDSFERAFKQNLPAGSEADLPLMTVLSEDPAAAEIAEFATRKGVDLIVMGAHTASALATHFSHGTAGEVFAKAPCPVIALQDS